jgi:anaerobic selenocysteine-containing dehydrogenase
MQEKITACFLCPCNCGLMMTLTAEGRIEAIRGDKDNPRTHGFSCPKGRHQASHMDSPHRVTQPLKKVDGRLQETSWDEALDGVARGLDRIRKKYGPRAVGMAAGGSPHPILQNVTAYMFLRALGSRNMYSPISLEFTGKYYANKKMFGCSYFEGHPDFENARFILLVGTNPAVSHPLDAVQLKRAAKDPDKTVVVVDPRRTETALFANSYLPIRPSTDIYLFASMLQVILSEGLEDGSFTRAHSVGIREVADVVSRFTPEAVASVTAIDAETLRRVARDFAQKKPSVIFYDMGVVANRHATLVSWATKTLMLITGNMGAKGGYLFNPTLVNWNRTERIAFAGKKYTSRIRNYQEITGHMPVTVLQDEILTPGPGQVRAMVVMGCNPILAYTNRRKMATAFESLELLVSIDPFLTEVGRLADYVLPSCSYYEQDNISFGFHEMYPTRFVQLTRSVREPLGQSRPEWKIFRDVSKRMGVHFMNNPFLHYSLAGAERLHLLRRHPGEFDYQEVLFKILARAGRTSWAELEAHPHGLLLDGGRSRDMMAEVRTRGKKACLNVREFMQGMEELTFAPSAGDAQYPLRLATTCRTWANLNTMYRDEEWIRRNAGENQVCMNPQDAADLGIAEGETVILSTRTGEDRVVVAVSADALRGCVFLSHGWGLASRDPQDMSGRVRGAAASTFLSDEEGDAFSGMPFYNGVPCRVGKRATPETSGT